MRPEGRTFVADGSLPDWDASEEEIERREGRLALISRPVTPEEAEVLATCFGPDDCYGIAWTLVHLIETAPGPVPRLGPGLETGGWEQTLRVRWGSEEATARRLNRVRCLLRATPTEASGRLPADLVAFGAESPGLASCYRPEQARRSQDG